MRMAGIENSTFENGNRAERPDQQVSGIEAEAPNSASEPSGSGSDQFVFSVQAPSGGGASALPAPAANGQYSGPGWQYRDTTENAAIAAESADQTGAPATIAPASAQARGAEAPILAQGAPAPVAGSASAQQMAGAFAIGADETHGTKIWASMFGGNYFFANGNASISDETFAWAQNETGVTNWRYPGGSISEKSFDMGDDRHFSKSPADFIDAPSGDKVVPMSRFFKLAGENNTKVTMVIPTREGLIGNPVKTGPNDDISARNVSKAYLDELSAFVKQAVELADHWGTEIEAFEIGNEFWGSGQMNQIEYGKLAGLAAVRIHNALESTGHEADILVQTVHSRNEYNDNKYGHAVQPGQIADGIKAAGAADMIDGIVNHIYARNFDIDENAKEAAFESYAKLETALYEGPGGRSASADKLDYAISEWNLQAAKAGEFGYGLKQATVMVEMFHEIAASGIDSAHVWKIIGTKMESTAMTHVPEAKYDFDPVLKHSGATHHMLEASLKGLVASNSGNIREVTDVYDVEYFTFVSDDRNVAFVVNQTPWKQDLTLDFSELVEDFGDSYFISATVMGDDAGAFASSVELAEAAVTWTHLSPQKMGWSDGVARVSLQDWEILRLEATAITPGADILNGGFGRDLIIGKGGSDKLMGNAGNDILIGGSGGDILSGGAGRDRAQYINSKNGLVADLVQTAKNTGQAAGDRYLDIEDLFGTRFGDTLNGDGGVNRIYGHNGDDLICGRGGDDMLFGMNGSDRFIFKRGHDKDTIKDFEAGIDTLVLKGFDDSLSIGRLENRAVQRDDLLILNLGEGDHVRIEDVTFDQIADDILIL